MYKISDLYDYPITVTSEDFVNYLGIELENVIAGDFNKRVTIFLDTIHRQIYDFLIYNTGNKVLKNSVMENYSEELTNPVKRALLLQGQYLLSGNNIELFNGVIKSIGGVEYKEVPETIKRILAPSVINILSSTKPNILFAGSYKDV